MAKAAAQTSNSTTLAQTIQNLPTVSPEASHSDLVAMAERAIEQFIEQDHLNSTPLRLLVHLFSKEYKGSEGHIKFFDHQVDTFYFFLKDIFKTLVHPSVSQMLIERGWEPEEMADFMERLVSFFDKMDGKIPQAHLRLSDIKHSRDEYTQEELQSIIREYTRAAAAAEASNKIYSRR